MRNTGDFGVDNFPGCVRGCLGSLLSLSLSPFFFFFFRENIHHGDYQPNKSAKRDLGVEVVSV